MLPMRASMKRLVPALLVGLFCYHTDGRVSPARHGFACNGVAGQCVITSPTTTFIVQPRSILRYVEFSQLGRGRHVTVVCR